MWFLNRPPVFEDEPGVVVAAAWSKSTGDGVTTSGDRQGRTMQAWVAFDPVWDNGRVTGYYANVTRMRPDAHPGVLNLIMKTFLSRWVGCGVWGVTTGCAGWHAPCAAFCMAHHTYQG
jgi:hypothetical protein